MLNTFGASDQQYRQTLLTLGFRGNFVNGYRIYIEAFFNLAKGKYYTEPATADGIIQKLVNAQWLRPTKFFPDPQRRHAISLIGYNSSYVKNSLSGKPVAGHFVDWDYEVIVDVDQKLAEYRKYQSRFSRVCRELSLSRKSIDSIDSAVRTYELACRYILELDECLNELRQKLPNTIVIDSLQFERDELSKAVEYFEDLSGELLCDRLPD